MFFRAGRRHNSGMPRLFHRSVSVLRAIERARGQPAAVCFAVRDDEKPSSGGMTVRKANLPAEVRKPDDRTVQTADQVIAEIAAKIAPYKPKPEWEGMSPEEMYWRGWDCYNRGCLKSDPPDPLIGGVPRGVVEAIKWWRRAAERGHAKAQFTLAARHSGGDGVPKDYAEEAKWLRLAAEQDHVGAQEHLGLMYSNGNGVPQDYAEAAKWLRRAAADGHGVAQKELASMYRKGEGVPQDDAEAEKWLRRAAGLDVEWDAERRKKLTQIVRRME